jgi:hypothetical protein
MGIAKAIRTRLSVLFFVGEETEVARTSLMCLELVDKWKNGGEVDLYTLLWMARLSKATDPRDKVYALLGLAWNLDRPAIIPDYSTSTGLTTLSINIINY